MKSAHRANHASEIMGGSEAPVAVREFAMDGCRYPIPTRTTFDRDIVDIPFEPTSSFCYRFARYKALPEILTEPVVASGEQFRLIEYARKTIDKYLTLEQQQTVIKRAKSDKTTTVGADIRFFVSYVAKDAGYLHSLGKGQFRLPAPEDVSEEEIEEATIEGAAFEADETGQVFDFDGTVYAFSFPILVKHEGAFPIKVGMATGDAQKRVDDQCRYSSSFDNPVLLGQWPARKVRAMESAIHNVLKSRGKWRENVPGKEWFDTTVAEIDAIVRFVHDDN